MAFQEKDQLTDRKDITTHSSAGNDLTFTDKVDYWKGYSCATGVEADICIRIDLGPVH